MQPMRIVPAVLEYVQAPDAVEQLASRLRGKVLFVGGKRALEMTLPRLTAVFEGEYRLYTAASYPCEVEIRKAMAIGRDCDAIVGIGGGRAIDTGKTAAAKLGKTFYTLPTEAATCAPTARLYVNYRPDGSRGIRDNEWFMTEPIAGCFADTTILKEAPNRFLSAGIADSFAKLCEPWTAEFLGTPRTPAWNEAVAIAEAQMETYFEYGQAALNGDDEALSAIWYSNFYVAGALLSSVGDTRPGMVLAHAVYDGACDILPGERDAFLHGEYVAVGVLLLLKLLPIKQLPYDKVLRFFRDVLRVPTTLEEVLIDTPQRKAQLLQNMVERRIGDCAAIELGYKKLFGL